MAFSAGGGFLAAGLISGKVPEWTETVGDAGKMVTDDFLENGLHTMPVFGPMVDLFGVFKALAMVQPPARGLCVDGSPQGPGAIMTPDCVQGGLAPRCGLVRVPTGQQTSIDTTTLVQPPQPASTLSIAFPAGAGSVVSFPDGISCGNNCAAPFPSGTIVGLFATPASGSTAFAGWSGACSGTGICRSR